MSLRRSWWRRGMAGGLAAIVAAASAGAALGYAEEAGSGDGPDAAYAGLQVSTHHTHLTRALAYCAGLPALTDHRNPINPLVALDEAEWAERLALRNELNDKGTITGTDADGNPAGPVWTNVNTTDWSYRLPTAAEVGCEGAERIVYPVLVGAGPVVDQDPSAAWDPQSGWFTHRLGPWAGHFHFPQQNALADDLAALRAFATGESSSLVARSLYGFGASGANMWSGSCYDQRIETVATGPNMLPGTLPAFAAYLHTLGDSYSHRMCSEHWLARQTPPWPFHTPPNAFQETCGFNDHSFEFGCPDTPGLAGFLAGTIDGAVAVYGELVGYALAQGFTPRVLAVDAHGGWLRRQIERYAMSFQNNFNADAGTCRVSFTYALLQACGAIPAGTPGCLPDVDVAAGGTCADSGKTTGCENGTPVMPMTPACGSVRAAAGAASSPAD